MLTESLSFDWDDANIAHVGRHNVKTVEVEEAIANHPLDVDYDVSEDEERWTVLVTQTRCESSSWFTRADHPHSADHRL